MPRHLTPEQLAALRVAPLGDSPNRLRVAIALAGAKQTDVCEETGFAFSTLSRLVTGANGNPTIETARTFAEFFGCGIDDLFPARQEVA